VESNKVSSIIGRGDSWRANVPSVVPSLRYSLSEKATEKTRKHPKWQKRISDHESDADSESGSPYSYSSFLVTIRLSRRVSEIFACDRRANNTDHHYRWPPHCGGPANINTSVLVIEKTNDKIRDSKLVFLHNS